MNSRVAEAVGPVVARPQRRVPDHRHDRPRDDVPLVVHRDRDHRLDVEDVLRALLGPEIQVGVVLERQADQVADGVLCELGEVLGAHCGVRGRHCQRGERKSRDCAKCGPALHCRHRFACLKPAPPCRPTGCSAHLGHGDSRQSRKPPPSRRPPSGIRGSTYRRCDGEWSSQQAVASTGDRQDGGRENATHGPQSHRFHPPSGARCCNPCPHGGPPLFICRAASRVRSAS